MRFSRSSSAETRLLKISRPVSISGIPYPLFTVGNFQFTESRAFFFPQTLQRDSRIGNHRKNGIQRQFSTRDFGCASRGRFCQAAWRALGFVAKIKGCQGSRCPAPKPVPREGEAE